MFQTQRRQRHLMGTQGSSAAPRSATLRHAATIPPFKQVSEMTSTKLALGSMKDKANDESIIIFCQRVEFTLLFFSAEVF